VSEIPGFSDEFYDRWEHLLSTVEIVDVPMRFIKEVEVTFKSGDKTCFDITAMISNGNKPQIIESKIEEYLQNNDPDIRQVDFHINIPAVATEIERKTNKLLDK
jgi:hypothetical protein